MRGLLWFAGPDGRKRAYAQLCGVGDFHLQPAEVAAMTYREMWDSYVEPNLPPEPDPVQERTDAEVAAVAAALTLGGDIRPILEALKKERPT